MSALLFAVAILTGCSAYMHQPLQQRDARIGEETRFTNILRSLPAPKEKVVVAVYKFRDQTGQYKPTDVGANWSTAVTQGGTNILVKALDDSGWFLPIERENVSNLLNERKIIRSSRQQFADDEKGFLPPLLYAGIILEGGIVSYDANTLTGGIGVRYFGTGGGGQYRQDRVTVYLRAVSTKTGKVLKTVYTSKTLLSQAIDFGVFRFVSFERLLEAETGITYNEPSEMAVTEAIEKAVHTLVMEGMIDSLWIADQSQQKAAANAITKYKQEKEEMRQTDLFGAKPMTKKSSAAFNANYAALRYEGDFGNSILKSGYDIGVDLLLTKRFSAGFTFGSGRLESEQVFNEKFSYFDISGKYRMMPDSKFSPIIMGGIGTMVNTKSNPFDFGPENNFKIFAGVGFEYMLTKNLGLQMALDNNYILNDNFDQMDHGKYNDYYWRTRLGIVAYFGNQN